MRLMQKKNRLFPLRNSCYYVLLNDFWIEEITLRKKNPKLQLYHIQMGNNVCIT